MDQVRELEIAILSQARKLATVYREGAQRSQEQILQEARQRIQQRKQQETLRAQALAERSYRRLLQANELKLQREMDILRWNLVEGVMERLQERMLELMADRSRYLPLLRSWLDRAADAIERPALVAEVNSTDLEWLRGEWGPFSRAAAAHKQITLATTPLQTVGGILVRSDDNRIRIDNTFEGRMERLSLRLHQVATRHLLADNGESGDV